MSEITASLSRMVDVALEEDIADVGDITSQAVIPAQARSVANLVARVGGVIAGTEVIGMVFARVDPTISVDLHVADGDHVERGDVVAVISGPSRAILTGERTALNILARMSGVASATAQLVAAVEGTGARITDTRKTMPGMRSLDKAAVVAGGGVNHRMGLYDEVMIKDNHIVAAGDIRAAVAAAREFVGPEIKVTVEVEDMDQLALALETDADRVLLDNMTPDELREAVQMIDGRVEAEASGGVTLDTARAIAESGVDFISVGWVTHSAPQMDLALDFV